jgi:hypothetical protein
MEVKKEIIVIKKKRGRPKKSINKKKNNKKDNLLNIKQFEKKNIIKKSLLVHLPINIALINEEKNNIYEKHFYNYNNKLKEINTEPEPYDDSFGNPIQEEEILIKLDEIEVKEINLYDKKKKIKKKIYKLINFIDFKNINDEHHISCWWCTFQFDNLACGIPIKYEDGKYKVKGYFCSFNCALSYNKGENIDYLIKQERMSLLNLLYNEMEPESDEIAYAPKKECLKKYGGILSIEEFRKNTKVYKLTYPPILPLIPELEEIEIVKDNKDITLNKNISSRFTKQNSSSLDNFFK